MCLGTIQVLEEVWEDDGARVGRLADGTVVSLGFVPDAAPGELRDRAPGRSGRGAEPSRTRRRRSACAQERRHMSRRATGIALAFVTACISGVSIWVNSHAVTRFGDATVYTTAKNAVAGLVLLSLALLSCYPPREPRALPTRRRQWPALLAIAVIGGSVPFVLFFEGLARAEATQAAFIQKTLGRLGRAARRSALDASGSAPRTLPRSPSSSPARRPSPATPARSSSAPARR